MARKKNTKNANGIFRSAREAWENTKERAEGVKEQGADIIKNYPLTSIAIAAGVGALVALGTSMLLGRKERSFWDRLRDY